jgi:hypothetical protein
MSPDSVYINFAHSFSKLYIFHIIVLSVVKTHTLQQGGKPPHNCISQSTFSKLLDWVAGSGCLAVEGT